jgi:hypothetical protein
LKLRKLNRIQTEKTGKKPSQTGKKPSQTEPKPEKTEPNWFELVFILKNQTELN